MKFIFPYLFVLINLLFIGRIEVIAQQRSLFSNINNKSWTQLLEEDENKWHPPYTVNLLIHPVHSSDWLYVNPSMVVSRRSVIDVATTDHQQVKLAKNQEDLTVQFAFDNPAFIPDFKLTTMRLKDNKYPIAEADYFANDIYYKIKYVATAISTDQSVLSIQVIVKNESDQKKEVHVRSKVAYYPEEQTFEYHYIPFNWTSDNWKPYDKIYLKDGQIYKENKVIGEVKSEGMKVVWEDSMRFVDKQYEDILYPQVWYGSGYALPQFRLKDIQDVIHASADLAPGDSTGFSLKILVNENKLSDKDLQTLFSLSPSAIEESATIAYQNQFNPETFALDFKAESWSDILTELQLNTLQLLVKYPGKDMYQPTQGGSSERFYVWVFEAVLMLKPMLKTGQFDAVKKGLDYIFDLQDAGYPPEGRFTTTQGSIGTTGPRWANTTGMALALASDYYLYSKDPSFIKQYENKILKAVQWISGEVRATRKMNADGSRPLTYGLMPFAVASDGDKGYFFSATDVFSFWGFDKAVQLLEQMKHPEAKAMREELELYRKDLLIAINHLAEPNGYINRKIAIQDKAIQEATKFENTDIMAPIAVTTDIIDPNSEIFQQYIKYYEQNIAEDYFLGKMDRDIFYVLQCEYYWQPIYLALSEWKKAFMTLQTCLRYAKTPDTHQIQERFSKRDPSFAPWQPNGSGNGRMIEMMLNALYFEYNNQVTLLGGIPFAYIEENKNTMVKNLYTLTGRVNIEIKANGINKFVLELSSDQTLPVKIQIPAHFHAKAISKGVKLNADGIFELQKGLKKISFHLQEN